MVGAGGASTNSIVMRAASGTGSIPGPTQCKSLPFFFPRVLQLHLPPPPPQAALYFFVLLPPSSVLPSSSSCLFLPLPPSSSSFFFFLLPLLLGRPPCAFAHPLVPFEAAAAAMYIQTTKDQGFSVLHVERQCVIVFYPHKGTYVVTTTPTLDPPLRRVALT